MTSRISHKAPKTFLSYLESIKPSSTSSNAVASTSTSAIRQAVPRSDPSPSSRPTSPPRRTKPIVVNSPGTIRGDLLPPVTRSPLKSLNVQIVNLPPHYTSSDITSLCSDLGARVSSANKVGRTWGSVTFRTAQERDEFMVWNGQQVKDKIRLDLAIEKDFAPIPMVPEPIPSQGSRHISCSNLPSSLSNDSLSLLLRELDICVERMYGRACPSSSSHVVLRLKNSRHDPAVAANRTVRLLDGLTVFGSKIRACALGDEQLPDIAGETDPSPSSVRP